MRDCDEETGEKWLGCTPQAYKACACLASRPKKEDRVSRREISSLVDGKLTCLRRGPGQCPTMHRDLQAGLGSSLCSCQERSDYQLQGELISAGLPSYQGNQ